MKELSLIFTGIEFGNSGGIQEIRKPGTDGSILLKQQKVLSVPGLSLYLQ